MVSRPIIVASSLCCLAATGCGGGDKTKAPKTQPPKVQAAAPVCQTSLRAAADLAKYVGGAEKAGNGATMVVFSPNGSLSDESANADRDLFILRNTGKSRLRMVGRSGSAKVTLNAPAGCAAFATVAHTGDFRAALFKDGVAVKRLRPAG